MVIHRDKLRSLLWLRYKLFVRSADAMFRGVFFTLFSGGLAFFTFMKYRNLPAPANAEILFLALTFVYLVWIIQPLLLVNANEGLDLSKLILFPLTRGEIMLSLIFSTLLDTRTLALVLLLGAVVLGWGTSIPLVLIALLAMIIFSIQLIGMGQLVLALLPSVLQGRRLRDFSFILTPLFTLSTDCLCLATDGLSSTGLFTDGLKHGTFSHYLQWLPPGMAAQSIQQAAQGNWGASFAWLGMLTVISIVVLYLWQVFVDRRLTAADEGGSVGKRVRHRSTASPLAAQKEAASRASISILPPQVSAVMVKDWKCQWRTSQPITAFLSRSVFCYCAFLVVSTIYPMQEKSTKSLSHGYTLAELAILTTIMLLWFWLFSLEPLINNVLSVEERLTTFFLFPLEPKHLLWGKNLTLFLRGTIEILVLSIVIAILTQSWILFVPTLIIGLSAIAVMLAIVNITSIFLLQHFRMPGRKPSSADISATAQSSQLFMEMTIVPLVVMPVVLLPVFLAIALPLIYKAEVIWTITIPASLLYSAVIYYAVTVLVARRMLDRAPEILAVVTRE